MHFNELSNTNQNPNIQSTRKTKTQETQGSGVWILPSYFNHSCVNNLTKVFHGDVMLIYAKRDMKAGEELTLAYFDFEPNYEARLLKLKKYAFECKCERCVLDKYGTDVALKQKRNEIAEKVEK